MKTYKWVAGQFILPSATHLLACSNKAAKWLFTAKQEEAKILKNGIESDQFAYSSEVREQVRHELNLSNDCFVVGHVGRFAQQKNHSFLLELFAELNTDIPDTVLVLAGDGPLRLEIKKKAMDLQLLDKVRFLGVRSDITRLLQVFDVFVFPSWHEGLPVTLIEAQGAGLPCLISNVISEEVDMGIDLIEYLPLNDKLVWVNKIKSLMARKSPREISASSLRSKGYDIKNSAAWAEGFYLAVSGDYL